MKFLSCGAICSKDEMEKAYTIFRYSSADNEQVTKCGCSVNVICAFIM